MIHAVKNLDSALIESLASRLRGEIILPKDELYDKTRKVHNAMIDKHPGMFVMCVDIADVLYAVNFGRENNLLISVRGGGHNAGGPGLCDDGMGIDLSGLKFVMVNTKDNTVKVGGGNIWD